MVVISASAIPYSSFIIFAMGARQLVVQEEAEIIEWEESILVWFTPITNIGAVLEGAESTSFLAPAFRCAVAVSTSLNFPEQSMIIVASTSFHFKEFGSFSEVTLIFLPSTSKPPSLTSIFPGYLPWTESYSIKYAR